MASGTWPDSIYLDVAAGVTVLILTGRYIEARAKRRSGRPGQMEDPHLRAGDGPEHQVREPGGPRPTAGWAVGRSWNQRPAQARGFTSGCARCVRALV